jgi:hypothetical protein
LIRTTIAYLRYHSDAHVSATGLEEISAGLFGGKIFAHLHFKYQYLQQYPNNFTNPKSIQPDFKYQILISRSSSQTITKEHILL